jgi:hypothetical protein
VSPEQFGLGDHFPGSGEDSFRADALPESAIKRAVVLPATDQSFLKNSGAHLVVSISVSMGRKSHLYVV